MVKTTRPPLKADTLLFCTEAAQAPSLPGAYVLLIDLEAPLTVKIAGQVAGTLDSGRYLYCGSACGAGGLKAKLARHMRRGKAIKWHVDQLTEAGVVAGAWVIPGGSECALVADCKPLPVPVDRFGSSDCRRCRSHLLCWRGNESWPSNFDGLPEPPFYRPHRRSRTRTRPEAR